MSNDRIIKKIQALLAMTTERGATEHEASVAAAKAAEIMEEHGLSMMTIEREGGEGEGRQREESHYDLRAHWYKPLMEAIAESWFCHLSVDRLKTTKKFEFTVIGRVSAVVSAKMMFEYLKTTIHKIARREKPDSDLLFCSGMAERIVERIKERHATKLREQKEETEKRQREEAARSRHPSSAPTSTALVVTLVDYAQRETDLNEDFRRGKPAGTTERERVEREARNNADDQRVKDLVASGVEHGVAWNMVHLDMTRERAEEYEKAYDARMERERKKSQRRSSSWTRSDEAYERRERREESRRSSPSWSSGRVAGEKVGLDTQVEKKETRRLS